MARGSKTDAETVAKFRAEYLRTGNAHRSAINVGLPGKTGWDLANRANEDPAFRKARAEMYARALPDYEAMLREIAEVVHERILADDKTPEELAAIAVENDLKSFSYHNPKPAYIQALVANFKALTTARKLDAELSGEIDTRPALVIVTSDEPPDDAAA